LQSFTSSSENVKVRAQIEEMQEIRFRLQAGAQKAQKKRKRKQTATSG